MEWPKVKNIIILILMLLNVFLLMLVFSQRQAVDKYEQSAVIGAVQVLEQNGIEVAEDALGETSAPHSLTVIRDLTAEEELARILLGDDARPVDQSGGLYAYTTDRGTGLFRANGDMNFQFADRAYEGWASVTYASELLSELGIAGELVSSAEPGESGEIVFCQTVDRSPVWSCRLAFRYDEGRLLELNGTLVASSAFTSNDDEDVLDLPNALIRFMSGVMERGDLCSSVTSFRPGYRLTQSFGGDLRLVPVWFVTTNVGNYFLDGITGDVEPSNL